MDRFILDDSNIYEIIVHVCASIYSKDISGDYLGTNRKS
jgi:hypothetical protein